MKKWRLWKIIAGLLFGAASVWIHYEVKVVAGGVGQGRKDRLGSLKVGDLAPDFSTHDLSDAAVTLQAQRGRKVVLLDFWATWCPPCRMLMPSLQTLHEQFKDRGLEIIGVDMGEDREQVQYFIKRKAYTFRVAVDPEEAIGTKFGVRGLPTMVVVDRAGTVRWIHVGSAVNDEELKQLIEQLTKE